MLDLLGTIAGSILGLAGIVGLAVGLMTRSVWLAVVMGGLVGLAETFIFADFSVAKIGALDLAVAIIVGIAAGSVGSAIRRKGTTV